jgi:predicted nucleic acid-binding protein
MSPFSLPTREALIVAQRLHLESQWSFWDALIVGACVDCVDAGVTRLYLEILPGGPVPEGLAIINPFA